MSIASDQGARARTLDQNMGVISSVMMPLLELGIIGFASYVFIYAMGIQYLLAPPLDLQQRGIIPRRTIAIALLTIFCILLFCMLAALLRLIQIIWSSPGLIPPGNADSEKQTMSTDYFDKYAAFVCDYEGKPLYCDKCRAPKPDRTHHCRELNRCVRRMDHYCPWAGGIIAENSHKFFLQFLFWAALFTTFTMISLAVFLAERGKILHERPGTWIAALALAALFCMFTSIMFFMTAWNQSINYTTVETVQRGGVHNIAFAFTRANPTSPTISSQSSSEQPKSNGPPVLLELMRPSTGVEYVVLQTQPFEHPWHLGTMRNLRSILGHRIMDWFNPFKLSPCVTHDDPNGEFEWSQQVLDMAAAWQRENPGKKLVLLRNIRRNRQRRKSAPR